MNHSAGFSVAQMKRNQKEMWIRVDLFGSEDAGPILRINHCLYSPNDMIRRHEQLTSIQIYDYIHHF